MKSRLPHSPARPAARRQAPEGELRKGQAFEGGGGTEIENRSRDDLGLETFRRSEACRPIRSRAHAGGWSDRTEDGEAGCATARPVRAASRRGSAVRTVAGRVPGRARPTDRMAASVATPGQPECRVSAGTSGNAGSSGSDPSTRPVGASAARCGGASGVSVAMRRSPAGGIARTFVGRKPKRLPEASGSHPLRRDAKRRISVQRA